MLYGLANSSTTYQRRMEVKYVENIVSEEEVEPDSDKEVQNWPQPRNSDKVRQFFGVHGYYRGFLKGFSTIARLLNDLLINTKKKIRKSFKDIKSI